MLTSDRRGRSEVFVINCFQQSCSDSPAIANPTDGVFGTDSQRARMAAWRKKALADVRCFLERDGENLNS
jgi:hypothetical protein